MELRKRKNQTKKVRIHTHKSIVRSSHLPTRKSEPRAPGNNDRKETSDPEVTWKRCKRIARVGEKILKNGHPRSDRETLIARKPGILRCAENVPNRRVKDTDDAQSDRRANQFLRLVKFGQRFVRRLFTFYFLLFTFSAITLLSLSVGRDLAMGPNGNAKVIDPLTS